jgi:arsenate reductase (thioredoxin)
MRLGFLDSVETQGKTFEDCMAERQTADHEAESIRVGSGSCDPSVSQRSLYKRREEIGGVIAMPDHYNVLFLSIANSARSIMAEAILNRKGFPNFTSYSAGSYPKDAIHPLALQQIENAKLPITGLHSKSWHEFAKSDAPHLDFVFTLCDGAPNEVCPVWPGQPTTGHWSVPDPTSVSPRSQEQLDRAFLDVFTILERRISLFLCLPLSSLDKLAIGP